MSTNIKNRVPVYPGRVKLIPVAGQENTYDMERADSPTEDGSSVDKALLDEIGIHQMDYAYAENNHALAGLNGAGGLVNAIFIPSQNFSQNDTFTVDGTSYTGKLQSDDELYENFFIAGAVVSCVLDTENHTINFKSSGGSLKYASGTTTLTVTNIDTRYCYGSATVTNIGFKPKIVLLHSHYLDVDKVLYDLDKDKVYFTPLGYTSTVIRTEFTGTEFEITNDGFKLTDYKLDNYYVNPDDTEIGYSANNLNYIIYG